MVKNYYSILGISEKASIQEIKNSYRKLSLKFHPDHNKDDDFFTQRFLEIQEAYDILKNQQTRTEYNKKLYSQNESKNFNSFNPVVELFTANKKSIVFDDKIEFKWKCLNCTKVIIEPFGEVETSGDRSYRIKNFDRPTLKFRIIALNELTDKKSTKELNIVNTTYLQLKNKIISEYLEEVELEKERIQNLKQKERINDGKKRITLSQGIGSNIVVLIQAESGISLGDAVFKGNNIAKNGIYRMGWFSKIVVKDGVVVQIK